MIHFDRHCMKGHPYPTETVTLEAQAYHRIQYHQPNQTVVLANKRFRPRSSVTPVQEKKA